MPSIRFLRHLAAPALGILAFVSCSKTNTVDQSTTLEVGAQCGGPNDAGCGVGSVCALGFCRHGCTTDVECPQGAICVGDQAPFGCSLPAELACSSSQPCETETLTCGIDGRCRLPCEADGDCPRNEHHCIAGTCVGENERDYEVWLSCLPPAPNTPTTRCEGASFQECNVNGPGWAETANCGSDVCTTPEGLCLEVVVEGIDAVSEDHELTVSDGQLYWFDSQQAVHTSELAPGSSASEVLALPSADIELGSLAGGLLGAIDREGGTARMVQLATGTDIVSVSVPQPDSNQVRDPMPSELGLFWVEVRTSEPPSMDLPFLFFAEPGATEVTEVGQLVGVFNHPFEDYCTLDDSLYFIDGDARLYRATPGTGIEGPLTSEQTNGIACRPSDVLVSTQTAVVSMGADGEATPLLESRFERLELVGSDVFSRDPFGGSILVGNLVTGEVRVAFDLPEQVAENAAFFAADDSYVFLVAGQSILRGPWK